MSAALAADNGAMATQIDLFDTEPDNAASPPAAPRAGQALVQVPGNQATWTRAQRDFNNASTRLGKLRAHLAVWQLAQERCQQREATELRPLRAQLRQLQRDMVLWADAHLARPPQGESVPKRHRTKLVALIKLLAREVLDSEPDAQIEALHDRHSNITLQEHRREQADLTASVLARATGDDALFDGEAESVDVLMSRAAERLRARAEHGADAPDTAPPAQPGRPSRAEKAQARDAKALQQASQSVREVYRRLASSLHPDREPDTTERARKTALMAQVNDAYARQDLLTLLQLQMDLEQISSDRLAQLPDAQLRHFTRVLQEQQQAVQDELSLLQMPVASQRGQPAGGLSWPARMLEDLFSHDIAALRAAMQRLQHDGALLRDARTCRQTLQTMEVDDPDERIDPLEEMLLQQALAEMMQGTGRPQSGKRRQRR